MWVWVNGFTNHIVLSELITLIKQRGLTRFLEGNLGLKTVQTRMACHVSLIYFSSSTSQNGTTMAYKNNSSKPCYHLKTGFTYTAMMMTLTLSIHHTFRY